MADAWGIDDGYEDVTRTWHETPEATRRRLRVSMGGLADVDDPPPAGRPVWFLRQGDPAPIERPAELELEDGTVVRATAALPADLPLGYHDLHPSDDGPTTRLIIVPDRCAPAPERASGWTVQLYAARSRASWGIGDLGDLATFGRWARGRGAGFVAVSPLHAPIPSDSPEASPYFASTRRWRNPLHLRIEGVDGWDAGSVELAPLAEAGSALNSVRRIDRQAAWAAKRAALEWLWTRVRASAAADPRFDAFRVSGGASLHRYGVFCALAEHHGAGWRSWPAEHRRPDTGAVARFAVDNDDAVQFHMWVQWQLDRQVAGAADAGPGLVFDLAIGADPDGFDGWTWQDVLAHDMRVGAPPDDFNPNGQNWGLPPFVPWRLRAAGYEPLVELFRAAFAHGAGLRVDHAMGLFRLFWIPEGGDPGEGGYVRFRGTEVLDVLALESVRAGTFVIGEDLGTVEDWVRGVLAERDVLSYRLAWFEQEPPERWPRRALAAITTHDLPTVAGVVGGTDDPGFGSKLAGLLGRPVGPGDDPVAVAAGAYRRLSGSPCQLVAATLEDALGVVERPNVPGTTHEHPNWSLALPCRIDELDADERVSRVAEALTRE
jgi:4-alpha-glucanotransferase